MDKEIEEILRKHNLKGILPMQRCKQELLNLFDVSKQRELLIAFGMDSCFDQKSEQNKKFVTARVDAYLKNNL